MRNAAISVIWAGAWKEQVTGSDLSGMLETADCGDTRIGNHLHIEAIPVSVTEHDSEPASSKYVLSSYFGNSDLEHWRYTITRF